MTQRSLLGQPTDHAYRLLIVTHVEQETIAIPIQHVRQVLSAGGLRPVPLAPPIFVGVVLWEEKSGERGLLPVISFRRMRRLREIAITPARRIVVIRVGGAQYGILFDDRFAPLLDLRAEPTAVLRPERGAEGLYTAALTVREREYAVLDVTAFLPRGDERRQSAGSADGEATTRREA